MTSQTTPTQQKKRSEVFLRQQLTQAPQANEDVLFPPSPPHCSKASVTPRAQSPVSRPHPYYYPPRAAPQPRRAPAALLREHTPVLTLSRRRRFRKRTKRNPDGADAGPPAEPRTGTAETGGEAARALQPGRAAPLPPARRGGPRTAPRPGEAPRAGPERVAPESRRRKARPRPLPARLAPLRARAGPRKGPTARDPLQTAFPMQRPSRPQLTCRSWYRTAHADRRDRHGKLQPGTTAHSLRHSNGAALHAGPRPASLRLRQRRAVLCRNKAPSGGRSAATHRRPSEAGRGHRAVGGAVVPRGAQPPFPRARGRASFALPAVFPPRAAQQRLLKRAGGKGPVSKQAGSASLHSGVAHRRKAF